MNEVGKWRVGIIADSSEQFHNYTNTESKSGKIYYCITHENHLCSLNLDEIILLEGKDKTELLKSARINLKK